MASINFRVSTPVHGLRPEGFNRTLRPAAHGARDGSKAVGDSVDESGCQSKGMAGIWLFGRPESALSFRRKHRWLLSSRASATPLHGGPKDLGLLRVSCPSSQRDTNRTSGCSVWFAIHPPATIAAQKLDCRPVTPASLLLCGVWTCVTLNLHPRPPDSGCFSGAHKRVDGNKNPTCRQCLKGLHT